MMGLAWGRAPFLGHQWWSGSKLTQLLNNMWSEVMSDFHTAESGALIIDLLTSRHF